MKYLALLRGINVGGNNKVAMAELKRCFESLEFNAVSTYINSGNVMFNSLENDRVVLTKQCEQAIEKTFGFRVACSVIPAQELEDALAHAPEWWGQASEDKHNAIFVIPPATVDTIINRIKEAKPEYEKVSSYKSVIFWTAPLETFSRTRYSKIVAADTYGSLTIRNANTVRKLVALSSR